MKAETYQLLKEACAVEFGKGILIDRADERVAKRLVSLGYDMLITSPLRVLIISEQGRHRFGKGA